MIFVNSGLVDHIDDDVRSVQDLPRGCRKATTGENHDMSDPSNRRVEMHVVLL